MSGNIQPAETLDVAPFDPAAAAREDARQAVLAANANPSALSAEEHARVAETQQRAFELASTANLFTKSLVPAMVGDAQRFD